ncbi:MAG: ABC transporter permease [Holophagales bacterium]|nr:ABC transporter permease [Holophagales bacterium]MYI81655.1 ABC transporter permease [Holophagales bacterium]
MGDAREPGASARGRRVVWWIAVRYLLGGRSRLLTGTARSALGSTGLGVAAMVVSMALMSGYTSSVENRLLQTGPLVVTPLGEAAGDLASADEMAARLRRLPGVERVGVTLAGQGQLLSGANPAGVDVWFRGILPGASSFGAGEEELGRNADGFDAVVLGRQLQRTLAAADGELLRLTAIVGSPSGQPRLAYRTFRVAGAFETGFSEYDRSYAVLHRDAVETLGAVGVVLEVATSQGADPSAVHRSIEELVGGDALVTDWRRGNRDIFAALRLQKWGLFLVLGLIVLVSTFNIAAALVVMVRERGRDTAVLGALGLGPRRLRRVFLVCGLSLGAAGTGLGLLLGSLVSAIITRYELVRFDPGVAEIYFISSVPFDVRPLDLLAVAGFSLLVVSLACWWPARLASSLEPARALHWE